VSIEIDLAANQAMSPSGLDIETMAEKADLSVVVGTM
jgi:hypothetical protein